ncbi:MAG TPA: hypothetical protein VFI24_28550 [Pyrinomonadaceae bacterium]|nr:hypothetical protein [Pyrinomonadaceae bacterium]
MSRKSASAAASTATAQVDRRLQQTWAASRAELQKVQKELMAKHFADHDFLLPHDEDPATGPRQTAASILVNQGTTPNVVVRYCLEWVATHSTDRPFHITWYSPGSLVPASLHEFRSKNTHLTAATQVHLFPGNVDLQLQASSSREAVLYARGLKRHFSCTLLSGYSLDLSAGLVRFNFDSEIEIQTACALMPATQKFLFLDSEKFIAQGEVGYSLRQLLDTSKAVTIYTVSSQKDAEIISAFNSLGDELHLDKSGDQSNTDWKRLRLVIIGRNGTPPSVLPFEGILRRTTKKPRQRAGA